MKNENTQHMEYTGFTLIELVMVIALLSILAVLALPRMMDNYDDAHFSTVAATGGALSSAVILLRGQWVANGANAEVDAVKGYGNNNVATTLDGWPSDGGRGKESEHSPQVGADAQRCVRIWNVLLLSHGIKVATAPGDDVAYVATTSGSSICVYTYEASNVNSRIEYDLASGTVLTVLK